MKMKTRLFLVDYQVYFLLHGHTDKIKEKTKENVFFRQKQKFLSLDGF